MTKGSKVDKPIETPLEALMELQEKLDEAETELAGYRSVQDIATLELKELREKLAFYETQPPVVVVDTVAEAELKELRQKVAQLEADAAARAKSPAAEQDTSAFNASQAEYFAAQLEASRATIATLEQELLKVPAVDPGAFAKLEAKAGELESELAQVKAELEARESEIKHLQANSTKFEHETWDLRDRAEKGEADAQAAQTELKRVTQELTQAKAELDQFHQKRDIEADLRESLQDLGTKFEAARQAVIDLRRDSQAKVGKITELKSELEAVTEQKTLFESEALRHRQRLAELENADERIRTLEARLKGAEIELEAYRDLQAAKEQLQHRAALLEAELAAVRGGSQSVTDLETEVQQLRPVALEMAHLRAKVKQFKASMAQLADQLEELGDEPDSGSGPMLKAG